ncbi:MAG TPA: hypothetical protein VM580_08910, partial [Labilithrix sp.]|nr:hypothetical protein [Labilithrix sp.]
MFDHLTRCSDLTVADADAACASRANFEALLARLQQVSAPNTGCASIVIVLARLASASCDWVDGDLAIELLDVDDCTEIRLMTELGAGMRERLCSSFRLRAPLAEIVAALAAQPELAGALKVHRRSWKRVTLDVSEQVRHSTRPPRISEASLVVVRNGSQRASAAAPARSAPPRSIPSRTSQPGVTALRSAPPRS